MNRFNPDRHGYFHHFILFVKSAGKVLSFLILFRALDRIAPGIAKGRIFPGDPGIFGIRENGTPDFL
jgi:hypothetical protein